MRMSPPSQTSSMRQSFSKLRTTKASESQQNFDNCLKDKLVNDMRQFKSGAATFFNDSRPSTGKHARHDSNGVLSDVMSDMPADSIRPLREVNKNMWRQKANHQEKNKVTGPPRR